MKFHNYISLILSALSIEAYAGNFGGYIAKKSNFISNINDRPLLIDSVVIAKYISHPLVGRVIFNLKNNGHSCVTVYETDIKFELPGEISDYLVSLINDMYVTRKVKPYTETYHEYVSASDIPWYTIYIYINGRMVYEHFFVGDDVGNYKREYSDTFKKFESALDLYINIIYSKYGNLL